MASIQRNRSPNSKFLKILNDHKIQKIKKVINTCLLFYYHLLKTLYHHQWIVTIELPLNLVNIQLTIFFSSISRFSILFCGYIIYMYLSFVRTLLYWLLVLSSKVLKSVTMLLCLPVLFFSELFWVFNSFIKMLESVCLYLQKKSC